MTAPRSPWPEAGPRGLGRELIGALLTLAGLIVLVWLLATVDWRLPVALVACLAVGGGIYLGRGPADMSDDGEL